MGCTKKKPTSVTILICFPIMFLTLVSIGIMAYFFTFRSFSLIWGNALHHMYDVYRSFDYWSM